VDLGVGEDAPEGISSLLGAQPQESMKCTLGLSALHFPQDCRPNICSRCQHICLSFQSARLKWITLITAYLVITHIAQASASRALSATLRPEHTLVHKIGECFCSSSTNRLQIQLRTDLIAGAERPERELEDKGHENVNEMDEIITLKWIL
jgi:hypothetical protein